MKIVEVLLDQLPECHVLLSAYLAPNVITDGPGRNVRVIPMEQVSTAPAVYTEVHGCLPMALFPSSPGDPNAKVLAIHSVVSLDSTLCTTPGELLEKVGAHLAGQAQGSWQLAVGARAGLNPVAQLDIGGPARDDLLAILPTIESQHPNVNVTIVNIGTENSWDHLAFDPSHGFQQVVLDF